MRLLLPLCLLACEEPDKDTAGDTASDDTGEDSTPSPYTGSWSGELSGHADFTEDWETAPYCTGVVDLTVATDGSVTGSGDCTILWGPYMGLIFVATLGGQVGDDGALSLPLTLTDAESEHPWDDCTLTGSADATAHTGSAASDTAYHPVGLDPIEAMVRLTLE